MPRRKNLSPCSVDGCNERVRSRGMCSRHYDLWRRPPQGKRTKRHVMPSGYVRVWCPGHPMVKADGYALEHRKVVHDAGIPIPPGHHVHHINGDKADNRLENLEVVEASAHLSHHVQEASEVENQFGVWPVGDVEGQRVRKQAYMREWRRKNRDRIRAYKQARVDAGFPRSSA